MVLTMLPKLTKIKEGFEDSATIEEDDLSSENHDKDDKIDKIILRGYYITSALGGLVFVVFVMIIMYNPIFEKLTLRKEKLKNNEFYFKVFQFQELTRIYGKYFQYSDKVIERAMEDASLWQRIDWTLNKDIYEVPDNLEDQLERSAKIFNLNTARIHKKKIHSLKQHFQELTNETKDHYLARMNSSFSRAGVTNLWNYFLTTLQQADFSKLKNDAVEFHVNNTFSDQVRLSNDKNFFLYDRVLEGRGFEKVSKKSNVVIATQASIRRIHSFVLSFQNWHGPISVSVFLQSPEEYFLLKSYFAYVLRCHESLFNHTRFSVATAVVHPIPVEASLRTKDFDDVDCSTNRSVVSRILLGKTHKTKEWIEMFGYPQNMMRNMARHNALSPYHITLDIDIVPSPNLYEALEPFFASLTDSNRMSAFVIPTYEVSDKVKFPQNKNELVKLSKKGEAQPFHKHIYSPNQLATNFRKWEKAYDSFTRVRVLYTIKPYPLHYEPFFVEHESSPPYNESFIGYGFTRSSHALVVSKIFGDFKILSPVFTIQLGIQKVKEWPADRQRQNEQNRRRFEELIKNVDYLTAKSSVNEFQSRTEPIALA